MRTTRQVHSDAPPKLERIGRYPVIRHLATGGMSWVYEVDDPNLRVSRALKLLKPRASQGREQERFEQEARLLAQLRHPNLVTVHDFGTDPNSGLRYYTMELIEGSTLSGVRPDWLDPSGRSLEQISELLLGTLNGLEQLHRSGIVHRDLKPDNVFVTRDGSAVLGDLGIAKHDDSPDFTRHGYVPGTPLYMSPEQVRGLPATPASDVFSMGLLAYRVLTSRTVYESSDGVDASSAEAVLEHLRRCREGASELEVRLPFQVPERVAYVIRTACRIEPKHRYRDAGEMRQALLRALAQPAFEDDGAAHKAPRRKAWATSFGLVCAAALAMAAFLVHEREPASAAIESLRAQTLTMQKHTEELLDWTRSRGETLPRPAAEEALRQLRFAAGEIASAANANTRNATGPLYRAQGTFEAVCGLLAETAFAEAAAPASPLRPCERLAALRLALQDASKDDAPAARTPSTAPAELERDLAELVSRRAALGIARISHSAFQSAVSRADSIADRARAAYDLADFETALPLARDALESYADATAVRDALSARRRAEKAAEKVSSFEIEVAPNAGLLAARSALQSADWRRAKAGFTRAAGQLRSTAKQLARLVEARAGAIAQREKLAAALSFDWLLAPGDEALADAGAQLVAGNYEAAARLYDNATNAYANAPVDGPKAIAETLLNEYAKAYAARDLERLEAIWRMGLLERAVVNADFRVCGSLSIEVRPGTPRVADGRVEIDFDQQVAYPPGCARRPVRKALSARLVRQDDGDWRIAHIGGRS